MKKWGECLSFVFVFCLICSFAYSADFSDDGVWQRIPERKIQQTGIRTSIPRSYLTFQLNREILQNILRQAPLEFTSDAITKNVLLSLPLPDGTFTRIRIEESPIMQPGLAAKFPKIKTYRGQGVDDRTITVRLGWTSGGFHAFGLTTDRSFTINAYRYGDIKHYISFWGDQDASKEALECSTISEQKIIQHHDTGNVTSTGPTLRIFEAALAANGEFTQRFPPGTKDSALNDGIIPATNNLNVVFEREFAVRLVIIDDELNIIYTDPATDPYTGNDKIAMLDENQTNTDNVIGSANYDIGHVFGGLGGGGVAYLGVPCSDGWKARGVSTSSSPSGNGFTLLVAHEMGHQFDTHHTFNGTTGNCGGGNRNGSTAWEPGSGCTIMSYAGLCGSENLQGGKIPYYHVGSYDLMNSYVSNSTCDTETATGNNAPSVNAGNDYTIPIHTPFTLTATGSDPDGDSLTYSWEQFDTGNASPPNTDDGSRPIFRPFTPTSSPSRTFPQLSDILNNTDPLPVGEAWPETDRTLNFRITARDNHSGGGGVNTDAMVITVENGAGPFLVTYPDTNVTWNGGTTETITWNVAGTNSPPINTANVRILLSLDGGQTFTIELAASTPNDGSQDITVPLVVTTTARVKIEAIGNIFFDISNANFTINTSGCTMITVNPATLPDGVLGTAYNQTITATGGTAPYTFAVTSGTLPPGLNLASDGGLTGTPTATGNYTFVITATDVNSCTGSRSYTVSITSGSCLFCDDFNDGTLSTGWTYVKQNWTESGGFLAGTPIGRKAIAIATPIFGGCGNCTVEAEIQTAGGPGNRVWLLAWYIDKKNTIELLMKEENDFWVLKQKSNGSVVAKGKAPATIDPLTTYDAKIVFDGNQFQVYINNTLLITLVKAAGTNPNGTVGFQSKLTTGSFDSIDVN
jgi:hypothetical protein